MAGMPYPPTSVLICAICGRLFSARSFCAFRAFCGNLFPPMDFSLGGYGILPYPRHLLWDILPQNTPNSQNLLLRCPPTEYAEFTEPPTEMSSHGFHRFTQILRVRCSPTEFTEYTEFGSVGMAGMPYPPTSVRIRAICGRLFSARGSVYSVHSVEASSPLVLLVQFLLWQAAKPSGDSCTPWVGSVGMAGMPYPPTSVRSVRSVGVLSLQEVLCIRCIPWELLHRLFGWCSRDCCTPWRNPRK